MKILMLSIDTDAFLKESTLAKRLCKYGSFVDELHVVVYTRPGFHRVQIASNVFVYPTNTHIRELYPFGAYRIIYDLLSFLDKKDTVITSQEGITHLMAVLLKIFHGYRLELQVHTDFFSPYFKRESFKNYFRFWAYKISLRFADCIRVVSERIKHSLVARNIPEEKITVLPIYTHNVERGTYNVEKHKAQIAQNTNKTESTPVVELEDSFTTGQAKPKTEIGHSKLSSAISSFETTILMVDRLEREKDVLTGIRAFARVADRHADTGLVIVGDGSLREELRQETEQLGIAHRVVFAGWVDDVSEYYRQADIFLHTSLYEGYGLALVEAAVHGLPIVTTDVGIVGEVLVAQKSALVCAPGDVDCLARYLSRLTESLESRGVYAESAQKALNKAPQMTEAEYYVSQARLWKNCVIDKQ